MQKLFIKETGLIFIMLVSSFFAFTQVKKSDKYTVMEVQADTLMGRQDFAGALALYNKIIHHSRPATEEEYKIYYKSAVCYYGIQNFQEALRNVNAYMAQYPLEQAKLLRAYINQELNDHEAQLADLNDLLAINPVNPELLPWRASVLMEAEKYDEARKDIQTLLTYQHTPELKSLLGLTYYYQNNTDSALIIFDETIAEDPAYLQPYLYAASLCIDEEAYDFSLAYINKGLHADPLNTTLLFYKGIALAETNRKEEGCRCLTKAFNSGMDEVGDYLKQYCYGSD